MRRRLAPALILLAACGGGPSKASFIEQADDLCRREATAAAALPELQSDADVPGYLSGLADLTRGLRQRIAGLDAPADGRDEQRALLRSLDHLVAATERAAVAPDGFALQEQLQAADLARGEADGKLVAYGFEACGDR